MEITLIDNIEQYASIVSSIKSNNKYFKIPDNSDVYIINNKHIITGIVVVNTQHSDLYVSIYQPPRVCRISVYMLIEASVLISKISYKDYCKVIYNYYQESYSFKYKDILKQHDQWLSENPIINYISATSEYIKSLGVEDITKRKTTFNGKEING